MRNTKFSQSGLGHQRPLVLFSYNFNLLNLLDIYFYEYLLNFLNNSSSMRDFMKSSSNSILHIIPGQEIIETSPVIILLYMCSNKHYEQYV